MAQEEAIAECEKRGLELVDASIPGPFTNEDPCAVFQRHMAGAIPQMECQVAVDNMKDGRDRTRKTSTEVSPANKR
eukprot:2090362-Pyramimonas_sp.AAC.1